MTKLQWGESGDRLFETGLDRGVLYLTSGLGVTWDGLTSIEESARDESDAYFFDGRKYGEVGRSADFTGKIKAVTYPDEFLSYEGKTKVPNIPGLRITYQRPGIFGLSYRTLVGDDVESIELGYKIHILYNLLAIPDEVDYETLSDDVDIHEFGWSVSSRPEVVPGYLPTSHVIADSRHMTPTALTLLEDILYGTEMSSPTLPSLNSLLSMLESSSILSIRDNGDGTWTAEGPPEYITMLDETTFEIDGADVTYLDVDTYEITTT